MAVCSASSHALQRHNVAIKHDSDCDHESRWAFIINDSRIYLASIFARRSSRTQLTLITSSNSFAAARTLGSFTHSVKFQRDE